MQKNSKAYSVIFALIICLGCGVLLALVYGMTEGDIATNKRVEKKSNILTAVKYDLTGKTNAEIEEIYSKVISERVIDVKGTVNESAVAFDVDMKAEKKKAEADRKLPLFIYANEEGEKFYILPMRGNGLWGPVWGSFLKPCGTRFASWRLPGGSLVPSLGALEVLVVTLVLYWSHG